MKTVAVVLILLAAAGAGLYWFLTLPATFTGPEGWQVCVPRGWEPRPHEGGMSAEGAVQDERRGAAFASFHPFSGGGRPEWPGAAIDFFGVRPEEYRTEEIDGNPAVVMIFTRDSRKQVGAVVDRGDGLIVYRIGCDPRDFGDRRAVFERLARRIRCGKP